MVNLGSKVHDNISGFSGIATVRTEHLHGCVHITIESTELDKDGLPQKGKSFDEQRVVVDEESKIFLPKKLINIDVGNTVRDIVTGYTGIVVLKAVNMYGTVDIAVQSTKLKDGMPQEAQFFFFDRLELVENTKPKVSLDSSAPNGFVEAGPSRL